MICPYCGQVHPPNASYCPTTGKRLVVSKSSTAHRITLFLLGAAVLGVVGFLIFDPFHLWNLGKEGQESRTTSVFTQSAPEETVPSRTEEPLETKVGNAAEETEGIYSRETSDGVEIHQGTSQIGTTRILDRNGKVLYEILSPSPQMQIPSKGIEIRYPHWVNYVRSLLESQYDAQTIYRSGLSVYTTLDPDLQELAQEIVKDQVARLADKHATDGSLVAIRPSTGEILAMVGSADFYNDAISGQVNMAVSPRQPGTSITPLTYVAAFEKGWTPSTLVWDVPSEFTPSGKPDDPGPVYKPVNYDNRFHGPVTVRSALANSYNVPAVKALNFVGIYDDPNTPAQDGFIPFARRMGITTLNRPDYGLSLTLGGGEVTLLELTGAYATFANNGTRIPPVAITRIVDHTGNLVYEYQQPPGEQVVRSEHAYLINSILTDNEARSPAFGSDSLLRLPFTAAVKTGTTNDFRDNWTLGYTPELAVGVWVGNADYTPMVDSSGVTGAAPIWNQFMQAAIQQLTGGNPAPFSRPGGVVEKVICAISGAEPSEWCPRQGSEIFAADQPPLPKERDLWTKVVLDTWTNLRTSSVCGNFTQETFALNVTDPWAIRWIQETETGQAWAQEMGFSKPITFAPMRECRAEDPNPRLVFVSPREGETITTSPLEIVAIADASAWFKRFRLEYGPGKDPAKWELLTERDLPVNQPEEIYRWNLSEMPEGELTLRLYMESTEGTYAEKRLYLEVHR
jgi:membrane carboxypeptidase/penicillin-binding protein PbpC